MAHGLQAAIGSTYNYLAPYFNRMIESFEAGRMREAREQLSLAQEAIFAVEDIVGELQNFIVCSGFSSVTMYKCKCFHSQETRSPPTQQPCPSSLGSMSAPRDFRSLKSAMTSFFDFAQRSRSSSKNITPRQVNKYFFLYYIRSIFTCKLKPSLAD